ncbi:MAG: murein biosynthesis integral membrane protein MurJ [Neisseriaceae bacterium]
MAKHNLLKSLVNVSGMTLISRIVGFIRDMLMARIFGAGFATDAFFVAFKLPNLLRRVFAEGAFSQAFVPVLAEYKLQRSLDETRRFVANVAGLLLLVLVIVVVIGMVFTSTVIMITAPGFTSNPQKLALTNTLLRITLPYIVFISMASLIGGILNTWRMFSIPAFTPTILNLSFICFALFLRKYFQPPILVMAWALLVGGILQLAFQLPYLKKIGMPFIPRLDLKNKAVWRVVKLMGPAVFAMSVSQISLVINTIFASFLPSGSISWMYFADRLMEFPTGILGVALGTILLPSLSKYASSKDISTFSKTLDWGIKLCLLLALPATVGLAVLSKQLTMTLFMYGKFKYVDVVMTSYALIAYAIGLMGLIMVKILAPGFYANQDIRTPVKIAIFVLISTQLMNLLFIGPFKHAGLALSIGLGACINAFCLYYFLVKRKMYIPQQGFRPFISKLLCAVLVMAIVLIWCVNYLPFNFTGHIYLRVLSLLILLSIAIIIYFGVLFIFGVRSRDFVFREID